MADGAVPDIDLTNVDIPDKDILSSEVQQNQTNSSNYQYQSKVEDKGEFVYPESFETDFALSVGYYEALSRCASTGDLYISSLTGQAGSLDGNFGVGKNVNAEIANIQNDLNSAAELSAEISAALVGNLAVYSAAVDETVGAIKEIRKYINEHIDEYGDMIVDGNLVIKDNDRLFEIMKNTDQFDVDLLKLAQKEAKKTGTTLLSMYVKEVVGDNFKKVLIDSGVDAVLVAATEGNFFQALGTGVGSFISTTLKKGTESTLGSEAAQKLISEELSKVLKLVGGSTAGAIVSFGANWVIKNYILDEQWTHEDTIKGVVTGAESAVIGVLGGLAGFTGGLTLIPALATVAITTITGDLIHDWYYTDGIPAYFDPYSIPDHLKKSVFNIDLINVNGQACVPEIGISVLKAHGLTEDEAAFIVSTNMGNDTYLSAFKDDQGNFTRDYEIYSEAYHYAGFYAKPSDNASFLKDSGYTDSEIARMDEICNNFSDALYGFNGVDGVFIGSTGKEISAKKLYQNSTERQKSYGHTGSF